MCDSSELVEVWESATVSDFIYFCMKVYGRWHLGLISCMRYEWPYPDR